MIGQSTSFKMKTLLRQVKGQVSFFSLPFSLFFPLSFALIQINKGCEGLFVRLELSGRVFIFPLFFLSLHINIPDSSFVFFKERKKNGAITTMTFDLSLGTRLACVFVSILWLERLECFFVHDCVLNETLSSLSLSLLFSLFLIFSNVPLQMSGVCV